MIKKIVTVVIAAAALVLIGYGCWLAWPPAGFAIPGLLIWIDVTKMTKGVNNVDTGRRTG